MRIRIPPPKDPRQPPMRNGERVELAGNIATVDDYARSEMCTWMFFKPWACEPNLIDTQYAFTDPGLMAAADKFKEELRAVSKRRDIHQFMPLEPYEPEEGKDAPTDLPPGQKGAKYADTIPSSIQY